MRKFHLGQTGYWRVSLDRGGRKSPVSVHRLLGEAFLGLTEDKVINHKDGVRTNNSLDNLEVVTQIENMQHSVQVLGNTNGWSGKKHRQETKDKIGANNAISQKGEGNSQYGTMWITDGVSSMKIRKDAHIPEGFRKGRTLMVGGHEGGVAAVCKIAT